MPKQMFEVAVRFLRNQIGFARQGVFVLLFALVLCVGLAGTAAATTTSSSPNYSVTETQFGSGSALNDCSASYCAKLSAGDTAVGRASSNNYSAQLGSNTSDVPYLAVSIGGGAHDMGVLDDTHTVTATNTVDVTTYLSGGYVIQLVGATPSQGVHNLSVPLGEPGDVPFTSQQGAEQFGINLVANTAPAIGSNAVNEPSGGALSAGIVQPGYDTQNEFKYIDGDVIVNNPNGSGEALYTLSMIINVSSVTPGGHYSGGYSAVVIPTF